ncbi:MAG: hypothetical protein ACKVOE_01745 [Rickettsiales bacterium]
MARKAVAPTPTTELGNPAQDWWLREQFDYDNVEHLIESGKLLSLSYDFETTGLDPMFAAPTMFCGKIITLDGRIIDTLKMDIQVPKDVVVAPQAAIVTQSPPKDLYSEKGRVKPHLAAAKMMLYFRNPYRALWDQLEDSAMMITGPSGKEEEVRVYSIASRDGKRKTEIRIHQGGKYLSYRYPDRVDHYCDVMERIEDKSALAQAIARVLTTDAHEIFNSETHAFNRDVITKKLYAFHGGMSAFAEAMKEAMGEGYPQPLYRLADADQLNKGDIYYDPEPSKKRWKKVESPAVTEGHNISRFDDSILRSFLHRYMSDENHLTHTKKFKRFRVDTLHLAKLIALVDVGGENSFKLGTKIDGNTGKPYKSYTLSSLMEANTRDANPERGVDEGVRMPDGSKYDRRLAHQDPEYDVLACISLRAFMRKRVPDVVRRFEENADLDKLILFLTGGKGFEPHPIRGFARYIHPNGAHLRLGVCVGVNVDMKERRQALLMRTDLNSKLEDYTYNVNGTEKKLLDMTADELAVMLKMQAGNPDALCEIIKMRKNPPVVEKEIAILRGAGGDLALNETNRRFLLSHPELRDKLMKAHCLVTPPLPDFRTIRNPRPEEHLFTNLANAKRYEFEVDGKKEMVARDVHVLWEKELTTDRSIDAVLRRAVKPQTVEIEVRNDTLEAFIERMGEVEKALHKSLPGKNFKLPKPDASFTPPKWDVKPAGGNPGIPHVMTHEECAELTANAVEYLWKLRAEFMSEFGDFSTDFTVHDRYGHPVAFPRLNAMSERDRSSKFRTGEYSIHKEQLNYSAELMACMFRDAGRVEWVKQYWADQGREDKLREWERWERIFEGRIALAWNRAPHEDIDHSRWMTGEKGLKDCARILDNLLKGDVRPEDLEHWGHWDIFMRNSDVAAPIVNEYIKLCAEMMAAHPLTDEKQRLMGYEPLKQGFPIEYARYEIPAGAKVLTLDVPDKMLERPLGHHEVSHNFIMCNPSPAQRKALAEMEPGTFLFLRGEQTGRTYLAAKPAILTTREISPSAYFHEEYKAAAVRFRDSGMEPPAPEELVAIAAEAFEPVPAKINESLEPIKVRTWDNFMATVSPELGYRDTRLTGLAIKHEGYVPSIGATRLEGMVKGSKKPGLEESGWEVPATITNVQTMTLKEARERVKLGREQIKAAVAVGLDSIDAARAALARDEMTDEDAAKAGLKSLKKLKSLMNKESFTEEYAVHYGYANLASMQKELTAMFVDHARDINLGDNLIHFIDFDPADKMVWHNPAPRPMVRLLGDVVDVSPPAPAHEGPDATLVKGNPKITRGQRATSERGT